MATHFPVFCALALLTALNACAIHPGLGGGDHAGNLGVSGAAVARNGEPAANGATLSDGDSVSVGADSGAMIELYSSSTVQLDAQTEVTVHKERALPGICSRIELQRGRLWADTRRGCAVLLRAAGGAVNINGVASAQLAGDALIVSVHSGKAAVSGERSEVARSGEQLSLAPGSAPKRTTLDRSALKQVSAWKDAYAFAGWCCFGRDVMPAKRSECTWSNFSFDERHLTLQCKFRDNVFPSALVGGRR